MTNNDFAQFHFASDHRIGNPSARSDKELYKLCKKFGNEALEARRKFGGFLPEVLRRRLYAKKGFFSIYHFAAKLAGMNKDQVDLYLGLKIRFEDKPILQKALIEGEISANKLVRIASIATVENQKELYETIKLLSNRAVETFVRDVKNQNSNGFNKPLFDQKSLHVQTLNLKESDLKLDSDVENELTEMQEKGININEFLREALKERNKKIKNEKTKIAEAQRLEQKEREQIGIESVRYVSTKIRKIVKEEHDTKCSIPGCNKPAKILHHMQRFALTHIHDPHFIAPLCEEHHEIAHKIDLKYAKIRDINS